MPSPFDSLRTDVPWMKDLSDDEILLKASKITGLGVKDLADYYGYDAPSSMMGKELAAGWERYKGGFGHIGGALGIPGAAEYAKRRGERADVLQALSPAPHSFEEMKLFDPEKGFLPYAGQLFASSAPYMAEAAGYGLADVATGGALTPAILARYAARAGVAAPEIIGGQALKAGATYAERRAAVEAAREAAPGLARTAMLPVVTYPSSLGDTLGNQMEESGRYNLPRAAAAAVPYAGLNIFGMEGAVTRGALPRLGLKGLEKNLLGRAASGVLATGGSESFNEFGQEVANQYARMGVNPNATFTDPGALERYKESAIGGAILGGIPGSLHAFHKPLDKTRPTNLLQRPAEDYQQQYERMHGMPAGGLGLPTQEQFAATQAAQSAAVQKKAEDDLMAGLYPPAAPTVGPAPADQYASQFEQAYGLAPGTMAAAPAAAPAGAAPKPKDTANAKRDETATPVDPKMAKITEIKNQLRDAYVASHLPADHTKTPGQIHQGITRLVGDPLSIEDAAATLRTKIAAVLSPGQGKGSKADRTARAEKMIQFHDEILGVPEAQRLSADDWERHLAAEAEAKKQADAAAKAKVGEAAKLPGEVTTVDPATLNAAAPATPAAAPAPVPGPWHVFEQNGKFTAQHLDPVNKITRHEGYFDTPAEAQARVDALNTKEAAKPAPTAPTAPTAPKAAEPIAKPKSPEEMAAYQAAITPRLTEGVAAEDLQALMLTRGKETVGDEGTNVSMPSPEVVAKLQQTPEGRKKLADLAQKTAEQAELETGVEGGAEAGTLRGVAKTLGITHSTLQGRVNRALAKIKENAAKNGLPEEAAHELLGLQTSLDVLDTAPPSTAYEGTSRVGATDASSRADDRPEAVEHVADIRGEEAPEVTTEAADEEAPEGEDVRTDTGGKPRTEFENKWVDANGQPILAADVQDAAEEYDKLVSSVDPGGRAVSEPTWEQLSPKLKLQWTRGYLGALVTFPKRKQEAERQQRYGAVRTAMFDQEEEQAADEGDTRTAGADTGADRQAEEGADVAGRAEGDGREVAGVSEGVSEAGKGGVSPAGTARTEGETGAEPAKPATTGTETKVEKKKKPKGTTTLEAQKVETSAERAERKWNEAAQHVKALGTWDEQTPATKAAFTANDEKDQKLADAMRLKEEAKDEAARPAKPAPPKTAEEAQERVTQAAEKLNAEAAALREGADAAKAAEEKAPEEPIPEVTAEQLQQQVDALPEEEQQALADHYGTKVGSKKFFTKLSADVAKFVNKGAAAVNGAIRSIISKIATAMLAIGLVFNPAVFDQNQAFAYDLPKAITTSVTTTTTKEVRATVPANAAAKMSDMAKRVYEAMAPITAAKAGEKAGRALRGFIIADKPNGMLHAFHADGTLMAQASALYGKDVGDEFSGDSLKGGQKITPAGQFTLIEAEAPEYAGGKVLALKETNVDSGVIAVHAVWLGEPKEQRAQRLASESPADNRISYGCINTTSEAFLNDLLPNAGELTGGPIFVLPDAVAQTEAMFPAKTETTTVTSSTTTQPGNVTATTSRENLPGNLPQERAVKRVAAKRRREGLVPWAKKKWGERVAPNGRKIVDNFIGWFRESTALNAEGNPQVNFHGTENEFETFKNGWSHKLATALGFHFAADPKVAGNIMLSSADRTPKIGSFTLPVYLRIENPLVITGQGMDDTEVAKAVLRHSLTPEYLHHMLRAIGHRFNPEAAVTMMQRWDEGKTNHIGHRDYTRDSFIEAHTTAALTNYAATDTQDAQKAIRNVVDKFVNESGYDGILYQNTSPMETRGAASKTTYIAFKPEQVKSASGNNGNFDEREGSIQRSEKERGDKTQKEAADEIGAFAIGPVGPIKNAFMAYSAFTKRDGTPAGVIVRLYDGDLIMKGVSPSKAIVDDFMLDFESPQVVSVHARGVPFSSSAVISKYRHLLSTIKPVIQGEKYKFNKFTEGIFSTADVRMLLRSVRDLAYQAFPTEMAAVKELEIRRSTGATAGQPARRVSAAVMARFSEKMARNEKGTETRKTATTAVHTRSTLKKLFHSDSRFDQRVTVVNDISEIPADVQAAAQADENTQAFVIDDENGVPHGYMIASNIAKGDELAVFLHEIGVHVGMENLIGTENMVRLAKLVTEWSQLNDGSQHAFLAKRVQARLLVATKLAEERGETLNDDALIQETIAYFVEEAVKHGINPAAIDASTPLGRWFRTLWAAAKAALRKMGLDRFDSLTPQDIVNLAYGAARLEVEGTWHGTAAEYRKFSHRFMSSGEGGQAFAWGSYLAQARDVAGQYWMDDTTRKGRQNKTFFVYDGEEITHEDAKASPEKDARYQAAKFAEGYMAKSPEWEYRKWIAELENDLKNHPGSAEDYLNKALAFQKAALAEYQRLDLKKAGRKQTTTGPEGSLFRVDVNIEPHELLDWDKRFDEQPQFVQDALEKAVGWVDPKKSGETIYREMQQKLGGKKAASEALAKMGIKGVRFLDQFSRDKKVDLKYTGPKDEAIPLIIAGMERGLSFKEAKDNALQHARKNDFGKGWESQHQHFIDRVNAAKEEHYQLPSVDTGTRNLVVFDDKNIQRVFTQVGANEKRVRYSHTPPRSTSAAATKKHMTNVQTFAQRHGLGLMITEDIADLAAMHGLPEVRGYVDTAKQREASRVEYEQPVSKVSALYNELPERERGTGPASVNRFIHDATMRGDTTGIGRLSAAGQQMVKAVFKHGSDILKLKQDLIRKEVGAEFDRRIAEEPDASKHPEIEKERAGMLKRFSSLMAVKNSDTYAPLKRFGDYVVSAKSAEYLVNEAADTDASRKWIADHETDPAHLHVEFADSQGEADAIAADLDPTFRGGKVYASAREADIKNHHDLFRAFPVLQARLAKEYPMKGGPSPMERIIRDMYLQALAETSARKSEMKRHGISGASHDMTRAFVTQGHADANFLADLKHNDTVQKAVQAMRKGAERDRRKLTPYLNEMLKRHTASYEKHVNRTADKLKRTTSMWMLSTNPTYYLQQLVQPWSMSLPVIAGTHGYFRTVRALQQGYKDVLPLVRSLGLTDAIDWSQAPQDVQDMLHTVSRNGAIDITNSMDQGEWEMADKGRFGAAWNRVDARLRGLNTRVEAINRSTTAIAAYRMELARNGGNRDEATKYAEAMVRQTHGSYDGSNTPRYLQGKTAQVLTQFRRFQIIQLSLIARLAHNAFKGSNATEKGIARRALTYTLMHTAALGGVMGMPGAALITSLVARMFGPSDEPPDFEKEAREAIGDQLLSDLLLKGVPAMFGVDLSGKFGMGQILSIAPFADFPHDRKSFEKYGFAVLGPTVGLGAKAADGVALIYNGEVAKGAEQLLPTGFANAMKGYRYASEGISTRAGDTTLSPDEITFVDGVFQALGMPTTTITHQQRLAQTKYEFDTYYKDRASNLIRDFQQARKADESTADVIDEWRDLQDARVRNGYTRQPLSTLIKSAQQQRKAERQTAGGVEFSKANKKFIQEQAGL